MEQEHLAKRITGKTPIHLVCLADDSESMARTVDGYTPGDKATEAIKNWLNQLYMKTRGKGKPYFRFSMITFGSAPQVLCRAEDPAVLDAERFMVRGKSGTTNMVAAFEAAIEVVKEDGHEPLWCPPFVFMFTDGYPSDKEGRFTTEACTEAVKTAERLKQLTLRCGSPSLVVVGFGDAKKDLVDQLASPGMGFKVQGPEDLLRLLPRIGTPTTGKGSNVANFVDHIRNSGEL